jgi:hypothetical protein
MNATRAQAAAAAKRKHNRRRLPLPIVSCGDIELADRCVMQSLSNEALSCFNYSVRGTPK